MSSIFRKLSLLVLVSIVVFLVVLILQVTQHSLFASAQDGEDLQDPRIKLHKNSGVFSKIGLGIIKPFLDERIDRMLVQNGFIDNVRAKVHKEKNYNIEIIKSGKGSASLHCGQSAKLRISQQEVILDTVESEMPKIVTIGIMGMKKKEIRQIITKKKKKPAEKSPLLVELIDFWPKYPPEAEDLLVFYRGFNLNRVASCGDNVEVSYMMRDLDGSLIDQSSNLIKFQIGAHNVPLALELGILGAQSGISRIIIAQPSLLKINENMESEFQDIDPQTALIIDLELKHIE